LHYLVEVAHGRAPVRHGTGWVGLGNLFELPLRFFIPEVMQQRDAAVKRRLHVSRARNWKRDCAEPFGNGRIGPLGRMVHCHLGKAGQGRQGEQGNEE